MVTAWWPCPQSSESITKKNGCKYRKKILLVLPFSFQECHYIRVLSLSKYPAQSLLLFVVLFFFFLAVFYKLLSQAADFLAKKSCRLVPLLFPPAPTSLCTLIQISWIWKHFPSAYESFLLSTLLIKRSDLKNTTTKHNILLCVGREPQTAES